MPKLGMEPIRRRQLIDATIASIHLDGFADATLPRISRRAGLSSGLIAHYFQDKAGLLEAVMRSLVERIRLAVSTGLSRARGPESRIEAIIDANFADEQFAPDVVTAWLFFWAQLRQSPRLARIQQAYERRLASNLLNEFKSLVPAEDARQLATGLAALMDGLWLKCALTGGAISPADARQIARTYVSAQLRKERPR